MAALEIPASYEAITPAWLTRVDFSREEGLLEQILSLVETMMADHNISELLS